MNASVRADSVHNKSFTLEHANLSISSGASKLDRAAAEAGRSSLITVVALGFGGVLTVAWAGALFWMAGYVVGIW
jgi:hypothetical protein